MTGTLDSEGQKLCWRFWGFKNHKPMCSRKLYADSIEIVLLQCPARNCPETAISEQLNKMAERS